MYLSNLKPNPGSVKNTKRLGRGNSSGQGKTSGKGEKGQNSRTGVNHKRGFEGGQLPLQRRVPKRGFTKPFRKVRAVINLSQLEGRVAKGTVIDLDFLRRNNLVKGKTAAVKVLGLGNAPAGIVIKAAAFSEKAKAKISENGGKAEVI